MAEAPKVKSIFVYPVKSCRAISVAEAPLTSTGLRWDRLWMAVNSKGRMYTQRVAPKLALVEVELPLEAFSPDWKPNSSTFLVMRAPGMNVLKVPLVEPREVANGVSFWEWNGSAFDEGEEAATWFSDYLEKPSRLVRFNEATECRPVIADYGVGHSVKFNDLYPFHLISQNSVDSLNKQLQEPISANRFRPNMLAVIYCLDFQHTINLNFDDPMCITSPNHGSFLIDGCEPFSEDLWNEIEINGVAFRESELCWRCKVPTVNQETAEGGSEPTKTLVNFRSDKTLFPNNEKHRGRLYMGTFLVCTNYTPDIGKAIRVGDPVRVMKAFSSYAECPN